MLTLNCLLLLCVGTLGKNIQKSISSEDSPLNLTPLIKNGDMEKARNMSTVDSTLFADVKSHAAFINIDELKKWNTFFWFFPAEGVPLDSTPWLIWLQGGPGSSSLFGLFTEIGPLEVVNGKAQKMPVTWGSNYSLLFIDNPVGAGFSYSESNEYVVNEDQVGACLLNFIQQFLQVFPELRKAPLFISGESYAGKFIPAFGHYIHHKNDSLPINLRGLAIGDGWTDPPTLLHNAELSLQLGFTDPEQANQIKELEDKARKYWSEGDIPKYVQSASEASGLLSQFAPVNVYNYLGVDENDYEDETYVEFVTRSDVRAALHVGNVSYNDMSSAVRISLDNDIYLTVKPWLEELIEHYGVMGYNGQLDLIVAYALSVNTYRSFKWSGSKAYLQAERKPILRSDPKNELEIIGYLKAAGNFWDVMVRDAGHMVPTDQPRSAKQIIDMFINKFKQ